MLVASCLGPKNPLPPPRRPGHPRADTIVDSYHRDLVRNLATGNPTGHTDSVIAVCAVPLPDGRTLFATGSDDRTVRLWVPATGQPIGQLLTHHTYSVSAVCAVPLPDGPPCPPAAAGMRPCGCGIPG